MLMKQDHFPVYLHVCVCIAEDHIEPEDTERPLSLGLIDQTKVQYVID